MMRALLNPRRFGAYSIGLMVNKVLRRLLPVCMILVFAATAALEIWTMHILKGTGCTLRPWRIEDAASVAMYANNRAIWRNLRDVFPSPFTLDDARETADGRRGEKKARTSFAIVEEVG